MLPEMEVSLWYNPKDFGAPLFGTIDTVSVKKGLP